MEQQLNNAFSFAHGEGKAYWFLGTLIEMKATGEDTNGVFSLFEELHPPGYETPLHLHRNEDEIFYVVEGEATFTVGEKTIVGKPGTFLYAPRNIQHKVKIEGSVPAKILIMLTPAGGEQFFVEASVPADNFKLPPETIVPDMDQLMAAAQKFDIEILG
ncbi:cupin domain-containing protein [Planococcus shenhongbingii]|uniref:Cupin domain-containing protein n=1 Tax=Planococcus shenhongbingii TaxID=3058398 RepID=A0ABT8NH27_9BACL|nr:MULTISPECIES: cupin domain-containing protein [unclassified Planococcus (in: firmicutes)]MDN7247024.1 cupin domain-containing protein [Planococcus sp. N017]WKA56927.1 cupin domain-containing protein [Planococcus sp. N016]